MTRFVQGPTPTLKFNANGVASARATLGVGPKGDKGDTGDQGIQGDKGDTGDQGPQGLPGPGSAAWQASTAVTTGAIRQAPDGSYIKSTTDRTTRASFDATEEEFWTSVLADPTTVDGKALTASFAAKLDNASTSTDGALAIEKLTKVSASGAARAMTIPDGTIKGQQVAVEKTDATTNTVTITGKIRSTGSSSVSLAYQYETLIFVWGGTYWEPLAGHRTKATLDAAYLNTVTLAGAGIDPTGVADSTSAIQAKITAAPNGSVIWLPPGDFKCGNLTITNKSNIAFCGQGTIHWTGTATGGDAIGIQLVGTLTNVTISGLRMVGDAVVANRHAGVWNHSGQTFTNLQILHNRITDVMLGISINADGSGDIDGCLIQSNDLRNIVGTSAGQGYGIQFASTDDRSRGVRILDNVVRRAQRHSIYVGKGSGVTVSRNHLIDHRIDVHDDSQRAALSAARGSHHIITDNVLYKCWDGSLELFPSPTIDTRGHVVKGNQFIQPQGGAPALTVGSTDPATEGNVTDSLIAENNFFADGGNYQFIRIYTGKRIRITKNTLVGINLTTAQSMIGYYGTGESGASATYSDQIVASFNTLYASAAAVGGTAEALGFRLQNALATSIARLSFLHNDITAIGGSYANMYAGTAVTNPNVQVVGDTYAGFSGLVPRTTTMGPTSGLGGTATLNFPSTAAGAQSSLTVTVTGAAVGDTVALGPPSTIEAGLTWDGFVSAANTVTIRVTNTTGSAIDPASASWKVSVFK